MPTSFDPKAYLQEEDSPAIPASNVAQPGSLDYGKPVEEPKEDLKFDPKAYANLKDSVAAPEGMELIDPSKGQLSFAERFIAGSFRNPENRNKYIESKAKDPIAFDINDAEEGLYGLSINDLADAGTEAIGFLMGIGGELAGGAAGFFAGGPAGVIPGAVGGAAAAGAAFDNAREAVTSAATNGQASESDMALEVILNAAGALLPAIPGAGQAAAAGVKATYRRGVKEGAKTALKVGERELMQTSVKEAAQLTKLMPTLKETVALTPELKKETAAQAALLYGTHPKFFEKMMDNPDEAERILKAVTGTESGPTRVAAELRQDYQQLRKSINGAYEKRLTPLKGELKDLELINIEKVESPGSALLMEPKFESRYSNLVTGVADELGMSPEELVKASTKELRQNADVAKAIDSFAGGDANRLLDIIKKPKLTFNDMEEVRRIRNNLYERGKNQEGFYGAARFVNNVYEKMGELPGTNEQTAKALGEFRALNREFAPHYNTIAETHQFLGPGAEKTATGTNRTLDFVGQVKGMTSKDIANYEASQQALKTTIQKFDPQNALADKRDILGSAMVLNDMTMKKDFKLNKVAAFRRGFVEVLPTAATGGTLFGMASGSPIIGVGTTLAASGAGGLRGIQKATQMPIKTAEDLINIARGGSLEQLAPRAGAPLRQGIGSGIKQISGGNPSSSLRQEEK